MLLLIDDADQFGEIYDEYAVKEQRVRSFHKGTRGVSSARNVGFDYAK